MPPLSADAAGELSTLFTTSQGTTIFCQVLAEKAGKQHGTSFEAVNDLYEKTKLSLEAHYMPGDKVSIEQLRWLLVKIMWKTLFPDEIKYFTVPKPPTPKSKNVVTPGYLPNCTACFKETGRGRSQDCPLVEIRSCSIVSSHADYAVRLGTETFNGPECLECNRVAILEKEYEEVKIMKETPKKETSMKAVKKQAPADKWELIDDQEALDTEWDMCR